MERLNSFEHTVHADTARKIVKFRAYLRRLPYDFSRSIWNLFARVYKSHEYVFQKLSKFGLFEKHTSANKFQIEREKSYDYFLIVYMKKLLAWLCLDSFRGRLDEQCSCLALAGSRRLFVFIRKVSAVCRGRQAPKYLILLGNSSSFLHVLETPTQYTVLFKLLNSVFAFGMCFILQWYFPSWQN